MVKKIKSKIINSNDNLEKIKANDNPENSHETEVDIKIPTDSRVIWAVQRFFLFSLVITAFKIYVTMITGDFQSLNVISIDAVIDLIVSGLGIYLIQMQQKVFEKVKLGTQEIKVNQNGVIGIASIQGLIFLFGGLTVFFQSIGKMAQRNQIDSFLVPPNSFNIISGLILAGVVSAKFAMYVINKEDSESLDNIALKSITSNLQIDIIVTSAAWIILLLTPYAPWIWFIIDPLIGIFIGFWMFVIGIKYLKPAMYVIIVNLEQERETLNNEKTNAQDETNKDN